VTTLNYDSSVPTFIPHGNYFGATIAQSI